MGEKIELHRGQLKILSFEHLFHLLAICFRTLSHWCFKTVWLFKIHSHFFFRLTKLMKY